MNAIIKLLPLIIVEIIGIKSLKIIIESRDKTYEQKSPKEDKPITVKN